MLVKALNHLLLITYPSIYIKQLIASVQQIVHVTSLFVVWNLSFCFDYAFPICLQPARLPVANILLSIWLTWFPASVIWVPDCLQLYSCILTVVLGKCLLLNQPCYSAYIWVMLPATRLVIAGERCIPSYLWPGKCHMYQSSIFNNTGFPSDCRTSSK